MPILIAWTIINFIGLIFLYTSMMNSIEWGDMLIYPRINEFLEDEGIDKASIVLADIFITLLFFPALLLYFTTFAAILLLTLVILAIIKLFEK